MYHLTRPQFVSKFLALESGYIYIKHLTTTAYHLQTIGQVERFNRAIFTRFRRYVAKHQRDRALYRLLLSYAYNTRIYQLRSTSSYKLVLSGHPPGPSLIHASSSATSNFNNIYPATDAPRDESLSGNTLN